MTATATVLEDARGFDALGDPASPAQLVADGWMFRTFYISQSSRYPEKINDHNWPDALVHRIQPTLDAGLGILLNFESSTRRCLEGAAAGATDGAWSAQIAAQLGYPAELPILISFDVDVRLIGGVDEQAAAYGWAFAAACRNPVGLYGGLAILHELDVVNVLGWQALARSWSEGDWPRARVHMRQRRATRDELLAMPYASALDVNTVTVPFDVWQPIEDIDFMGPLPAPAPPHVPQPTTGDTVITLYKPTDCDAQFLAVTNEEGIALQVEWTGPGNDPAVQATIAAHLACGAVVNDDLSLGGFKHCTLLGPLPVDDTRHDWDGSEFRRQIP